MQRVPVSFALIVSATGIISLSGCNDSPGEIATRGLLTVSVAIEGGRSLPLSHVGYVLRGHYGQLGWTDLERGSTKAFASITIDVGIPLTPPPDSIWFSAGGYPCHGLLSVDSISALNTNEAQLNWLLELPISGPQATIAAGAYCGEPASGEIYFDLDIDSVTAGLVYGRWDMGFRTTSSNQGGTFAGRWTEDILALQLLPLVSWPHCEARYRLLGTMEAGNTIGPVELIPDGGCEVRTDPFVFYAPASQ